MNPSNDNKASAAAPPPPDPFPWGYGLHPQAAVVADVDGSGRYLVAQVVDSRGRVLVESGRHADLDAAFDACAAPARALVAARLREMRRAGIPIVHDRLRQRQPWRFPDDPTNAARWAELQARFRIQVVAGRRGGDDDAAAIDQDDLDDAAAYAAELLPDVDQELDARAAADADADDGAAAAA